MEMFHDLSNPDITIAQMIDHYDQILCQVKDENGNLKAEYTIEGMHIKEEGYRAIFPEFIRYAME